MHRLLMVQVLCCIRTFIEKVCEMGRGWASAANREISILVLPLPTVATYF